MTSLTKKERKQGRRKKAGREEKRVGQNIYGLTDDETELAYIPGT